MLSQLHLCGKGIGDDDLERIAEHCENLKSLDLSYNPSCSDEGMGFILRHCLGLEKLFLVGTRVTDKCFETLHIRRSNLTHLGASSHLTDDLISRFRAYGVVVETSGDQPLSTDMLLEWSSIILPWSSSSSGNTNSGSKPRSPRSRSPRSSKPRSPRSKPRSSSPRANGSRRTSPRASDSTSFFGFLENSSTQQQAPSAYDAHLGPDTPQWMLVGNRPKSDPLARARESGRALSQDSFF